MITVGPTTVTATPFEVVPPTSGVQLIFNRVVISNHSQYLLKIRNGPFTMFIDPWTVNIVPYAGENSSVIEITPSLIATLINGASSYLTAQFYRSDEDSESTSYPSAITSPIDAALAVAQAGTVLIDNPFVANGGTVSLVNGVEIDTFFSIPAAGYQSYQLKFNYDNGAATAVNYGQVEIRFYDPNTGAIVWRDIIECNTGGVDTYVTDRCHGYRMTLFPTFPGGTLFVLWLLSNRPADRLKVLESPAGADRILLNRSGIAVAGGATSAQQFAPLFHGPMIVSLDASAGVTATWNFYFGSLANITHKIQFPGAPTYQELILPCRPIHYTVQNTAGALTTFFTSMWVRDN